MNPTHNCAGLPRRDFLQLGVGGLGLAGLLQARALAGPALSRGSARPGDRVNCIMIWLDGGPSHYETFDPKPDAPAEIRGALGTIPTAVSGLRFSEAVPELAKVAGKAVIAAAPKKAIGPSGPRLGKSKNPRSKNAPVRKKSFTRWDKPRSLKGRAARQARK